jgi:hypothetical protein
LCLSDGGAEADTGQQSHKKRFLGNVLDHCFPSLKKISKPFYPCSYLFSGFTTDLQPILP